jgi:hypothetical protein
MAIIPQLCIFGWKEIEELGDLERLRLVLEYYAGRRTYETTGKKSDIKVGTIIRCGRCGTPCLPA